MDLIVWAVRIGLAAVFAVAGAAKLRDRAGRERTAASLGVPAPLRAAVAAGVSVVELMIAALLVVPATGVAGAAAAAALLGVFLVALGVQYARGVDVPCACFGRLSSTPGGLPALARNAALGAAALFVLSQLV